MKKHLVYILRQAASTALTASTVGEAVIRRDVGNVVIIAVELLSGFAKFFLTLRLRESPIEHEISLRQVRFLVVAAFAIGALNFFGGRLAGFCVAEDVVGGLFG